MGASVFVGRVGGLAIALGIGAAAFSAAGAAWADDTPSGTSPAATGASAPARAVHAAGPARAAASIARQSGATPAAVQASSPQRGALRTSDAPSPRATRIADALADNVVPQSNPVIAPAPAATVTPTRALPAVRQAASAPTASVVGEPAVLPQPVILGPSGVPIPSTKYVDTVMNLYVRQGSTSPFTDPQPDVVFTPEGLYPITGVKSLPLNTSVDQGMTILSNTLAGIPAGTPTTVFGYSQSAIIGSLLQAGFNPPKSPYPPPVIPAGLQDFINFVFVGNEMNPNGGLLSRFPGLQLAPLGVTFYGATPENAYPTTNYTLEYDGFADFPRYPLNILADLNAGLGIVFVHTQYSNPDTVTLADATPISAGGTAIELPTTSPTQRYLFMPTQNLPLLTPLRLIPIIGNPLANLLQPALKVLVNLGYGDPAHGFESGKQPYANVLTPFGLFPEVNPLEVVGDLVAGVQQGVSDFFASFGPNGSVAQEVSAMTTGAATMLSMVTSGGLIPAVQTVITNVANGIANAAASAYAALLPTADIVNSLLTSLPAYSANLFLSGIQQAINGDVIGGLINAIGLPIAAGVGIVTTATLVEALVLGQAAAGIFGVTLPT